MVNGLIDLQKEFQQYKKDKKYKNDKKVRKVRKIDLLMKNNFNIDFIIKINF